MIVVDTSVWVAVLRSRTGPEAEVLRALLDADEVALPVPVRLELVSGTSRANRTALRRALSALPVLYPNDDTWPLIDGWAERAADGGHRFSMGDLLIGALATEQGALVWSLDDDFARMEALRLVQRYMPR